MGFLLVGVDLVFPCVDGVSSWFLSALVMRLFSASVSFCSICSSEVSVPVIFGVRL